MLYSAPALPNFITSTSTAPQMPSLATVVNNLGELAPIILMVVQSFCMLAAIYLTGHALYQFYLLSQPNGAAKAKSAMAPLVEIIVAACLLSLSQDIIMQGIIASWLTDNTTFSMPQQFSISDNTSSISELKLALGSAVENIMFLTGTLAIIKGLLILKQMNYGETKSGLSAVISHFVFGAFSLNLRLTIGLLDNSFGFTFTQLLFG